MIAVSSASFAAPDDHQAAQPAAAPVAPPAAAPVSPAPAAVAPAASAAPVTTDPAATAPTPAAAAAAAPAPFIKSSEGSVLFVAPNRLTVAPESRSEVLNVANKSSEDRRYDLMLVDQVMNANGVTQRLDTFPWSAKNLIKFQPRRFTLKPGEGQVIRVVVTRTAGLADGDYHSHLLFREVPLNRKDKEAQPAEPGKTVSFEIRTLYGIAVPVVVQVGKVTHDIALGDVSLGMAEDGKTRTVSAEFIRTGNAEATGRFSVDYAAPGKDPVPAGDMQWIRVYHEVDKITRKFELSKLPAGAKGGKIIVSVAKDEDDPSKTERKEIALP